VFILHRLLQLLTYSVHTVIARSLEDDQFTIDLSQSFTGLRNERFPEFIHVTFNTPGHAVAQLVEALHYKPEGRGFDTRWYHWIFSLT